MSSLRTSQSMASVEERGRRETSGFRRPHRVLLPSRDGELGRFNVSRRRPDLACGYTTAPLSSYEPPMTTFLPSSRRLTDALTTWDWTVFSKSGILPHSSSFSAWETLPLFFQLDAPPHVLVPMSLVSGSCSNASSKCLFDRQFTNPTAVLSGR